MRSSDVEDQPFLSNATAYADDPYDPYDPYKVESDHQQHQQPTLHRHSSAAAAATRRPPKADKLVRADRLNRDLLVFFLASLFWSGIALFLLPWSEPPSSSPSSSPPSCTPSPPVNVGGGASDEVTNYSGAAGRFHNVTSGAHFVSCGNSTAEARENGCRYDVLLNHWVPERCVDQEWIDEYEDDGSWDAFADSNLTQKLSPSEMGNVDHYYTSVRDHINHCAMLWRKQFWTLFEDRNVFDGVIVNSYHTEHCAEFLSNLMGMNRTEPTLVRVGYSGCWVRDGEGEL